MDKSELQDRINRIQRHYGLRKNNFPSEIKKSMTRDMWIGNDFTLGMEHGYMLAMFDLLNDIDSTLVGPTKENEIGEAN